MRRFQLIELHEQPWYPDSWRELFQLQMGRGMRLTAPFDNVTGVLSDFFARVRTDGVLDLCTGSGEVAVQVWTRIFSALGSEHRPRLVLSDLYPNQDAYAAFKDRYDGLVDFYPESVSALSPPADAPRVWSMIDSLHHFQPDQVRQILQGAARQADGFVALEVTRRTWGNMIASALPIPLVAAFVTAFLLRPFRFRNLLWGLLVPVVPLTTAVDGIVSNLRTYTVNELEEILRSTGDESFSWEVGTAAAPRTGGLRVTYVLGWRTSADHGGGLPQEAEAS